MGALCAAVVRMVLSKVDETLAFVSFRLMRARVHSSFVTAAKISPSRQNPAQNESDFIDCFFRLAGQARRHGWRAVRVLASLHSLLVFLATVTPATEYSVL